MIDLRLPSVWIIGALLCCVIESAAGQHGAAIKVKPCPNVPRSTPITRRCVAAAIAEDAFLKATQHQINPYMISWHGKSAPQWQFYIEQGDDAHPGPDGSHWFVHVDRATGKVEVVPGR
jgi:hypothetical protein